MNLFWSTRSLTERREDHLTEFFAAALAHVPSFGQRYADLVLGDFARKNGWPAPVIAAVDTQTPFPGTGCQPDMVLHLEGGRRIVCEHKVEAAETLGQEDGRGQLARYLKLPIDGLVYVRESWLPPDPEVLASAKYVRPQGNEHFVWADFYALLEPGNHLLMEWLREGFEWLGYTPPNPNVGPLTLRPADADLLAMKDFAKLWSRVRTSAAQLGWTVQPASRIQLYLLGNHGAPAAQVFISPENRGGFLVRFTPLNAARLEEVRARVTAASSAVPVRTTVQVANGSWNRAKVKVIDVRAARAAVMGEDRTTADELERRLLRFVEPLICAVSAR